MLEGLDNQLDAIHALCARDGLKLQSDLNTLFTQLWTRLGGNRASAAKLSAQLKLLGDVGAYRKLAWAHVSGAILRLQQIQAGLEDLRERVVMPDLLPEIPLSQHVATIQMGVMRLEECRFEARRVEAETYRRVMDRTSGGEQKERLLEGKE